LVTWAIEVKCYSQQCADSNTARPHSQIAWQAPDEFASTFAPRRSLALRYANRSAEAPAASPTQQGKNQFPVPTPRRIVDPDEDPSPRREALLQFREFAARSG
jgi:hypothetical protein